MKFIVLGAHRKIKKTCSVTTTFSSNPKNVARTTLPELHYFYWSIAFLIKPKINLIIKQ